MSFGLPPFNYARIETSMQIWIFGMLVDNDLLNKVPHTFPSREDGEYVSYMLRRNNIDLMLTNNASAIRRFGETKLGSSISGRDFFYKMKDYCRKNSLKEGYIPW